MAPAGAVFYGVYDLLKHRHLAAAAAANAQQQQQEEGYQQQHGQAVLWHTPAATYTAAPLQLQPAYSLMYGAAAGACAELLVYPLEVVRRRIQMQSMAAASTLHGLHGRAMGAGLAAAKLAAVPPATTPASAAAAMALGETAAAVATAGVAAAVARLSALRVVSPAAMAAAVAAAAGAGVVIKVPEGAVLRGCKKTRRKLRERLRLRAETHSQLRVIASLLVLRIFLTCLRRLVRNRHPMLMPAFEDPSNQALLAKLQELGSINLADDANTIDAHSMQLACIVKLYAKAARAQLGWSGEDSQLFIRMACGYGINAKSSEPKAATLDKGHVADLIEEANTHRRLLGMKKEGSLQDTLPLPCRMRHAVHVCRWLERWQQPPTPPAPGQPKRGKRRGVGPRTLTCPPPFTLTPMARVGVHFIKVDSRVLHGVCRQLGLTKDTRAAFTSEPALSHHWARWFNTNKLRNQGFAFESQQWDLQSGQLMADQLRRWKLTKGQVKHASGLNNARRDTERWLAPIKPHLQHLAASSSAGTSLEANLKHITVTLATWDAVWEVYMDPKWARQRLRLYGAQDRALERFFNKLEEDMAEMSMERHNHAKQLVVFFGAATIGTGGGWGADAVLRACRKVVCRPRGTDQLRGRVVLVNEHRTTRVISAVNGQQPCEEELDKLTPTAPRSSQAATQPAASEPGPSTPPPAKRSKPAAEPTKGKGKGKAAKAKPAPQPGRWLDRDCNAALNMQRIGESRWRPLELCYWPDQGALPARGKEYPGLGYKRVRYKPPKAQEQQQQPAVAQ
ncbi:hypothetical protein QJQ45_012023 [Haematococcus lacustris]|nr:hypothetical protein QJQ45_012023 [Haematococcus lacustris]